MVESPCCQNFIPFLGPETQFSRVKLKNYSPPAVDMFSTSQLRPSSRPSPVFAEQLWMCHVRSRITCKFRASAICRRGLGPDLCRESRLVSAEVVRAGWSAGPAGARSRGGYCLSDGIMVAAAAPTTTATGTGRMLLLDPNRMPFKSK